MSMLVFIQNDVYCSAVPQDFLYHCGIRHVGKAVHYLVNKKLNLYEQASKIKHSFILRLNSGQGHKEKTFIFIVPLSNVL